MRMLGYPRRSELLEALVAESIAARETIRFANRFFHEEVVLEGDSTEVLGYQP